MSLDDEINAALEINSHPKDGLVPPAVHVVSDPESFHQGPDTMSVSVMNANRPRFNPEVGPLLVALEDKLRELHFPFTIMIQIGHLEHAPGSRFDASDVILRDVEIPSWARTLHEYELRLQSDLEAITGGTPDEHQ